MSSVQNLQKTSKDTDPLSLPVEDQLRAVREQRPHDWRDELGVSGSTMLPSPDPDPPPGKTDVDHPFSIDLSRASPRISQELIDMIIDFISERPALFACCEASPLLVPRSRSHLYRRLQIKPRTEITHIKQMYTQDWLLPFVKEVEILGCLTPNAYPGDDANSGLNEDGEPDHGWMAQAVPVLARIPPPQVERLDLRDLSWGDILPATRQFLLTHFSQARRLTLSAIDFWNSNQMFRTLNAFPHIHGLSMENLSWHRANHARTQIERTADMRLRYLHVGQTEFARYGPFVKWLLGKREVVTVDEAFVVWEDTEVMSLIALLRRIGPSLKGLIYQQCMVMPGSEVVDARLEAAAAAAPPVPVPAVPAQGPPMTPAPNADNNEEALPAAPGAVTIHPAPQAIGDEGGEVAAAIDVDRSDDEGEDDAGGEEDADDDGAVQASGPPIEMADDEPEEESLIEESVAENLNFPREKDALREGMEVLNAMPVEGSMVERLSARIAWSSLALFGIKLMSQVFSIHTRVFNLLLVLPPVAQWDRIDWLAIDSILDDIAQHASKNATLELSFLGAFARRDDDLPSIYATLVGRLPLLVARKRWTAKYEQRQLI